MSTEKQSRTTKTIFNAATGVFGYGMSVVLGFVSRTIFLQYLAVELLGVNGLFTSILQVFSLAELGFATAVTYALYKPLSEGNQRLITAYMRYYAKIYTIIGLIVLSAGLCLLPFLQLLIKGFEELNITLNELRLYYVMFLISTASTYFIAYKRTLIISDQKKYVANFVNIIISILTKAIQIALIVLTKNFVIYLTVQVVSVYAENIIVSIIVGKRYPYLKQYKDEKLDEVAKKVLYTNIGALFVAKASSVFTSGIVSIIISAVIGLTEVGYYSNYLLLTSSATAILGLIFESATAGVGNFAVTENKDAQKKLFRNILYFNTFFAVITFIGLTLLFDSFIELWLGADYVLDQWVAIMMSLNMFIWIMRNTPWLFYNAYGLYKHFFYRSFFEIVVFLGLAIPGAIFLGIPGIIGAQIIAILTTQIPFEIYVVSKYVLNEKAKYYYKFLLKYGIITVLAFGLSFLACYLIPLAGLAGFITRILSIIILVTAVYFLSTCKTDEFRYYYQIVKNRLGRKRPNTPNTPDTKE